MRRTASGARIGAAFVVVVLAVGVAVVVGGRAGERWAEGASSGAIGPPAIWVPPSTTVAPEVTAVAPPPFVPPSVRPADAPYSRHFDGTLRLRTVTAVNLSVGTAFVVGDGTWAVTNRHVVVGAERIETETWDGRPTGGARVVALGEGPVDLAVLRLDRPHDGALAVSTDPPPVGAAVSTGGYPDAVRFTTAGGEVVAVTRDGSADLLITTVPAAPGSSGSPLLDDRGAVVGVLFAGTPSGFTLAVPAAAVVALLDEAGAVTT